MGSGKSKVQPVGEISESILQIHDNGTLIFKNEGVEFFVGVDYHYAITIHIQIYYLTEQFLPKLIPTICLLAGMASDYITNNTAFSNPEKIIYHLDRSAIYLDFMNVQRDTKQYKFIIKNDDIFRERLPPKFIGSGYDIEMYFKFNIYKLLFTNDGQECRKISREFYPLKSIKIIDKTSAAERQRSLEEVFRIKGVAEIANSYTYY